MEKVKQTYVLSLGLGLSVVFSSFSARAQEHFNPHLLETDSAEVPAMDLSLFAKDEVPPGDYNVDIFINGNLVDSKTLSFRRFDAPRDKCAHFREINGIAAAFQHLQKNYIPAALSFL
ncbi:FimD/PapC N-terminal domain-containing protein [Enterobacter hormaechei]|uniref:FimD/PapC N-terminal domain-containing protein n=1 Tax=Enterobacter hormaechei TaxID=158836 RepID=UPI0033153A23